jgi:16S rRNA (guanine966-N2)-methyltransferase
MSKMPSGSVRIIGGRWRGSKLPVADFEGLRPTADRVRETLFNWLQPRIVGARVLDLFAGTGALGLEAASRGARRVVLVERNPTLVASLRESAVRLSADEPVKVEVVCEDALQWLARGSEARPERQFDIVFVDPPFAAQLWDSTLTALEPWLAEDGWIYVEAPRSMPVRTDGTLLLHREGSTRDVRYALYRRVAATLHGESAKQDPARA